MSATPAPRNEASGTEKLRGGFDRDRHFLFRWPFSSECLAARRRTSGCSPPYLGVFYFRPLSHQPL